MKNQKSFPPMSAEEHRELALEHLKQLRKTRVTYILIGTCLIIWAIFYWQYNKTYEAIFQLEQVSWNKAVSYSKLVKVAQASGITPSTEAKPLKITIGNQDSLAFKNNNPGNLRYAHQMGAVEGLGGFASFPTALAGFEALVRQIKLDQTRNLSLKEFITKYAPKEDNNDTDDYVFMVSNWLGMVGNTNINLINRTELARHIIKIESNSHLE